MIAMVVFNVIVIVVMLVFWGMHGFAFPGISRFLIYLVIALVLGGAGAAGALVALKK